MEQYIYHKYTRPRSVRLIDLELIEYQEAYKVQRNFLTERKRGKIPDTLLLLEHHDVITIGRGGSEENILASKEELKAKGVTVFKADRGGDVTFHGPGQLVAYPIFDLRKQIKDVHLYLRKLEEVAIEFLKQYKVEGLRQQGARGIWVDEQKIVSIGIGVSGWITYHGLAINLNIDTSKFLLIKPCGMDGHKVTSLSKILRKTVNIFEAKNKLVGAFKTVFNLEIKPVEQFSLVA